MSAKPKSHSENPAKLIGLSIGGLFLGSAIPLFVIINDNTTSRIYLVIMEALGLAVMLYVFGLYLFKK